MSKAGYFIEFLGIEDSHPIGPGYFARINDEEELFAEIQKAWERKEQIVVWQIDKCLLDWSPSEAEGE